MVVDDRPDNDEQAGGKSGSPDDGRILGTWYDEHDLGNRSWEQVASSSVACPFDDDPFCKFDNIEVSAVELGALMLRVGGSPRG